MSDYRKIYEKHYGQIPRDTNGRSFDIHHIDGDRDNNYPDNLEALSRKDHYKKHKEQGDYYQSYLLSKTMKMSIEEISALASCAATKINIERMKKGTHHFLNVDNLKKWQQERVKNGTHHWLGPENNRKRIEAGTHNWFSGEQQKSQQLARMKAGTHHFLDPEWQKEKAKQWKCPYCGIIGRGMNNAKRWHFYNCKNKDTNKCE